MTFPSSHELTNEQLVEQLKLEERTALRTIFGVDFILPNLPQEFTPLLKGDKLFQNHLSICHFPELQIPNIDSDPFEINHEAQKAINALNATYPNWKSMNTFSEPSLSHSPLMPERRYWRDISLGITEQPQSFSRWLLVEDIIKPDRKNSYEHSPITEAMGINSRYISWNEIDERIHSPRFIRWSDQEYKGIPLNWRLPTILELNIIANRQLRESKSQVYEWTSTKVKMPSRDDRRTLIDNYYQLGGAHENTEQLCGWSPAMIDCDPPTYKSGFQGVAFRLVAELAK